VSICRLGSRFVAAAAILTAIAACSDDRSQIVTSPRVAPPPSPAPAPPPTSGSTLSGTVFEFTASGTRRPVPNLRLKVRAASRFDGAVGSLELPDVVTDANGRYEVVDAPAIVFFTTAPGSDYKFLCDFYPVVRFSRFLRDLAVVHVSWTGDRLPPGMWWPGTSVHGVVSERVGDTVRPLEGATVTLDTGIPDPPATTSATGFYMVCSEVGTDQYRTITASKEGYRSTTRQIFGGWEFRVDLEIARD